MAGPIKPSEIGAAIAKSFPQEVFDAFNELIVANWCMTGATVGQTAVAELICKKLSCGRGVVFQNGWLNVEEAYRKAGWRVEYDKPGYNENYEATFRFERPQTPRGGGGKGGERG